MRGDERSFDAHSDCFHSSEHSDVGLGGEGRKSPRDGKLHRVDAARLIHELHRLDRLYTVEAQGRQGEMPELRQHEITVAGEMPTLRQRLKRPETYLFVFALLIAAAAADTLRSADRQVTAKAYIGLVELYQSQISPRLSSYIRCRYHPTCSEYSRQAVERFGILRGLQLSWTRLRSCQTSVPFGTDDPVPDIGQL